jgi:hypothetical protein
VPALRQITRQLMVAGAAWLVYSGKRLVDQQNVHVPIALIR